MLKFDNVLGIIYSDDVDLSKRYNQLVNNEFVNKLCNQIIKDSKCKPQIKRVLYKNPAVIVFWTDNTKTVAKCAESDVFDREKGFMIAVLKKYLSSRNVMQMLEEWIPEDDKCEEVTLSQVFKCRDSKKKSK